MIDLIPLVVRGVIVTLILIVVLTAGSAVFSGTAASTAASQINTLENAVQTAYAAASDFTGLTCETGSSCAVLGTSIPSNLITSTGDLGTDSWGGDITIQPAAPPSGGGDAESDFSIEFDDVPQDACTKLAEQLSGYAQLTAGSGVFIPNSASEETPTSAAAGCGTTNSIIVIYGRG
jgi:hypothetical protein